MNEQETPPATGNQLSLTVTLNPEHPGNGDVRNFIIYFVIAKNDGPYGHGFVTLSCTEFPSKSAIKALIMRFGEEKWPGMTDAVMTGIQELRRSDFLKFIEKG